MDENGISMTGDVVDIGVREGVIQKAGSFYKYDGEVLAQGRESTKNHLDENPTFLKKVQKEIWDSIKKIIK